MIALEWHELTRVICYALCAPSCAVIAVVSYNRRQFIRSWLLGSLSLWWALLLFGLVRYKFGVSATPMLIVNTLVLINITVGFVLYAASYLRFVLMMQHEDVLPPPIEALSFSESLSRLWRLRGRL